MSRLLKVLCREATTRRRSVPALTLFVFAFVTAVPPTPRAAAQTLGARPRRVSDSRRHNSQATTKTTPTPAAQTRPQATPTPAIPSQQRQQQPPPVPVPTLQPQAGPGQLPADNSQAQDQAQEIEKDEIITVDTNLTTHNVRVIDRQNRPVNDVKQDEFRVFEDGVAQKIEYFSREEIPIQYGMVIDNSGSLRFQINQVIEAGKTIVNSNKPGDETFLVRFISSDKIETVQDFTGDQETLTEALDQLFVEGGQTAVIDAVMLSAERVANYRKGNDLDDRRRRALILVTDGEDRSSYYKQEDLFAALRENDVQIYVIGFINELDSKGGFIRKSSKEKAVNLMTKLAEQSGGRVFFPNSVSELPQIAQEITKDLRTQYVVGYYPTNKAKDGSFRSVRVQVADTGKRDKRIAVTRSGYTARRDPGAPQGRTGAATPPRPRSE